MKRLLSLAAVVFAVAAYAQDDSPVRITLKPTTLQHGVLQIPVSTREDVARTALTINGVPSGEAAGQRSVIYKVPIGNYVRRLRCRVTGYDRFNTVVGFDELVVNDPQPPFRAKLITRDIDPKQKSAEMTASVISPTPVAAVDFYYGESLVGTDAQPPYAVTFDPSFFPQASYARLVAKSSGGDESNDVVFFGTSARENVDVVLQRVPVSVIGKPPARELTAADFRVEDNGGTVHIEDVHSAREEPLNVILLIDCSQSMLDELPVIKQAAKGFARTLVNGRDTLAIVGFHERTFWLTPFTNNIAQLDGAIDRLRPLGRTHLYDASIEMLYELQKRPGRRALVVLTDGANDGGEFNLDNLVHYARYSGVPIYPVIKNSVLQKAMRFGVGYLQVRRVAEVAKDSGATYFIVKDGSELPRVYSTIANELAQQYTLLFYPVGSSGDTWHPLKVELADGTQLRAPKGYFP